jgi:hypothetical protein
MAASPSLQFGRIARVVAAVVALSAAISVRAAEQAPPAAEGALARDAEARFDVVLLRDGIALAGRQSDRRVEISRGLVMSDGQPLSGDEVRRRFGADADLVLRLSYLDNATLHRLFRPTTAPATAPPVPAPPVAAPPVTPVPPPSPPAPPVFDRPSPREAAPVFHRTGARIALAKPVVVKADEEVTDGVFSAGGSVRIEGRVRDGVVVIGGDLELTPTADVRGDLTVVGGQLTIAEGARHAGAVHHASGADWPAWSWSWPAVRWARFDPSGPARWLPLGGTLLRLLAIAAGVALVTVLARGRTDRIGAAAVASPLRAALVGVVTQLLFVPLLLLVSIVLAVTIIGLPFLAVVVPLAVLLMLGAMLLGFTSVVQRLGRAAGGGLALGDSALVAALFGLALLVLPTLAARLLGVGPEMLRWTGVALLVVGTAVEYVAWTVGLGAAMMTGLGRWAIVPPPVPPRISIDPMADAPSAI